MFKLALKSGLVEAKLKILNMFTGLFIAGFAIKVLGLEIIGTIQFIQALFLFILGISGTQVFSTAIYHTISQYNKKKYLKKIISSLNSFLLLVILIAFGVISIYFFYFSESTININNLMSILISIFVVILLDSISSLKSTVMNGFGNFVKVSYINGVITSLSHIIIFIFLLNSQSLYFYLILLVFFSVFKLIILEKEMRGFIQVPWFSFNFRYILSMKLVSKSSYIGSLSSPFSSQMDKVLVGLLGGVSLVPIYNFAQMALSFVHSMLYQVNQVYLKNNSKIAKKNRFIPKRFFFLQRWTIFAVAIVTYSLMVWMLPYLFYYLFPSDFGDLSLIFIFLASAQGLIVAASMVNNNVLIAYEKMKILAVQEWINSFSVFGFSIILGLLIGGVGIALARMAFLFQYFNSIYHIRRLYNIGYIELLKPYWLIGIFFINMLLSYWAWDSSSKAIYITLSLLLTFVYFFIDSFIMRYSKKILILYLKDLFKWKKEI